MSLAKPAFGAGAAVDNPQSASGSQVSAGSWSNRRRLERRPLCRSIQVNGVFGTRLVPDDRSVYRNHIFPVNIEPACAADHPTRTTWVPTQMSEASRLAVLMWSITTDDRRPPSLGATRHRSNLKSALNYPEGIVPYRKNFVAASSAARWGMLCWPRRQGHAGRHLDIADCGYCVEA